MTDTTPQTAAGKVLWHFSMSLDGYVAGRNHDMSWMSGFEGRPGLEEEYIATTGAVLGGRDGWDAFPDATGTYGGAWDGPVFVLTHRPEELAGIENLTALNCSVAEAVRIGLEAAGGKNLEILSADIGKQLLHEGLLDEIDLHIAPVLLGDGIRLYDNPGGEPIHLQRVADGVHANREVNVRYTAN